MTLIEILIVMLIMTLVLGGVVLGTGQLSGSRLKHASTTLTGAIRLAYTRATATSKSVRLAFDLEQHTITIEESSAPMLVQTKDRTGTGGAAAVTDAERTAIAEGERIVKGPQAPRPSFRPITSGVVGTDIGSGPRPLERGIKFREIQTAHDDEPRTTGRAYLYFWPGGLTERASIQLRIGDSTEDGDTLTLVVSPLTGKVTIKNGPVALQKPKDDSEASDREDRGL
jgi:general secretion pathway protein H